MRKESTKIMVLMCLFFSDFLSTCKFPSLMNFVNMKNVKKWLICTIFAWILYGIIIFPNIIYHCVHWNESQVETNYKKTHNLFQVLSRSSKSVKRYSRNLMQNSEKFRENLVQNLELSNNKRYRKIITLNIRILPYSRFSNLPFPLSNVKKKNNKYTTF